MLTKRSWPKAAVWALTGLAFALGVLMQVVSKKSDPVVEGARMSRHVLNAYAPYISPPISYAQWKALEKEESSSREVLRKHGDLALPLISDWLHSSEQSAWPQPVASILRKTGPSLARVTADRKVIACCLLRDFPEIAEHAKVLIPIVSHCITNQNSALRRSAVEALAHLLTYFPPDDPELIKRNARANISRFAILNLPSTNGSWRVWGADSETLIALADVDRRFRAFLRLSRGTVTNRLSAAEFLASSKIKPDDVVPVLMQGLNNRVLTAGYLHALGLYGPYSQSALPLIERLQDDREPAIKMAASNAMNQITVRHN